MSTVFDIFNNQYPATQPQNSGPVNFGQIQQFAKGINGNPEMMVRAMLQNGSMSQEQFNRLGQQATQLMKLFGLH